MQPLLDFAPFYQTSQTLSNATKLQIAFEPSRLKEWWRLLSPDEKANACQVNLPEIVSDFTTVTSDAFFLCKINQKYQQKHLISAKKISTQNKNLQCQEYTFNFIGKDIVSENIAQLFSAYILQVSKSLDSDQTKNSLNNSHPQSCFKVQEEHLDSWLESLETVLQDFATGEKLLFQKEHRQQLYSAISSYSFSKMSVFRRIESSSVQSLFHKLMSLTILIENQIYEIYSKVTEANINQDGISSNETINASTLTKDSILMSSMSSLFNQESECERRLKESELKFIRHASSDLSNQALIPSPTQTPESNSSYYEDSKNTKEGEGNFGNALSCFSSPFFSKIPYSIQGRDSEKENWTEGNFLDTCKVSSHFEIQWSGYEGFEMGDLEVTFDPSDVFLCMYVELEDKPEVLMKKIKQYKYKMNKKSLKYVTYLRPKGKYRPNKTQILNGSESPEVQPIPRKQQIAFRDGTHTQNQTRKLTGTIADFYHRTPKKTEKPKNLKPNYYEEEQGIMKISKPQPLNNSMKKPIRRGNQKGGRFGNDRFHEKFFDVE